jgi:hypothetical protein
MDESRHILMTVGLTSGLKWEFQQTQLQGRLTKLSLVIPPESAASIATTWNNLVSDLPPLDSCPEEAVVRSLAIRFRDTGSPVFISAEQRSVAGYRLALDACWLPLNELFRPPTKLFCVKLGSWRKPSDAKLYSRDRRGASRHSDHGTAVG